MAVVFDTHTWIKRLKEAGFTEEQAEAEVSLVREALAVNLKDLATKQDLRELELRFEAKLKDTESRLETKIAAVQQELAAQKTDIGWLKWLTGAIAVGILAQLLKSFGVI